jgi:hypothetical protein
MLLLVIAETNLGSPLKSLMVLHTSSAEAGMVVCIETLAINISF